METRVCRWCGQAVPKKEWCAACTRAMALRPKPEEMTPEEREQEMRALTVAEVPFELIHGRIEALVGRPVWTHEMAGEERYEALCKEARWEGRPATFSEIVGKLPEGKPVFFIGTQE